MKDLDITLRRAGDELRRAVDEWPPQPQISAGTSRRPSLGAVAVAVAFSALLGMGTLLWISRTEEGMGRRGGDAAATGSVDETTTMPGAVGDVSEVEEGGTPYPLLDLEGWVLTSYREGRSVPDTGVGRALVFRAGTADLGSRGFVVERSDDPARWSAGEGPDVVEMEGKTVLMPDVPGPLARMGGIRFDDGTLVVFQTFGMDRTEVVDLARGITLDAGGELLVDAPEGFDLLVEGVPARGSGVRRHVSYDGPGLSSATIRVWPGGRLDVELQAFDRITEAGSVRSTMVGGWDAVIARQAETSARVFVVGGGDGYVFEIDFNPFLGDDDALDAVLASIRWVDRATLEAVMPPDVVRDADSASVVAEMLSDVPLPEGFDVSSIAPVGDRYQVAAEAVTAVVCAWIDQWVAAREVGDIDGAEEAAAALAGSREWDVLLELRDEGALSEVVWQFADAVNGDGTVAGGSVMSVATAYESTFGCDRFDR